MIAYFLIHFTGPYIFAFIINLLIYAVGLALLLAVVVWIASLFGVAIPARVVQLAGLFCFLLVLAMLFSA